VIADEIIGLVEVESDRRQGLVQFEEVVTQVKQFPGIVLLLPEQLVDPGIAGLLVFEELVGDAAVGGDDLAAAVDVVGVAEDYIVDDLR
jgi:hypothetical protein